MRRIRSHLTYANVISTLALFAALGGGSFAIASLSGSDKKVVKRIANKQITKRAPRLSVKQATNADKLGGKPAGDFEKRLWAVVRSDGTLARGAGAISSSGAGGNYEVKFNRNISDCAFSAAVGDPADGAESFGETEANITSLDTAPDTVSVFTANSSGGIANRGFHLIVAC